MEEIRQEEKDYGPRESQIQMSPPLSFAPEAPVEPKGNARPSPNSPSASPRLEMSMRSPERAFPRGDGSGEEKEPRQPGRCDGCLQVFYSAAEKYDAAWENVLRFCGVALAAYIGSFIRIACTRIRVMQVTRDATLSSQKANALLGPAAPSPDQGPACTARPCKSPFNTAAFCASRRATADTRDCSSRKWLAASSWDSHASTPITA